MADEPSITDGQVKRMLRQIYIHIRKIDRRNAIMMCICHDGKRYEFPYSPYPLIETYGEVEFNEIDDYKKFSKELSDGTHDTLINKIIKNPYVLKFEYVLYDRIIRFNGLGSSTRFQLRPEDALGETY